MKESSGRQPNDLTAGEYATKDLNFAAFLRLKGMNIVRAKSYGDSVVYFIFSNKEQRCQALEFSYWNSTGADVMGNIKDYVTQLKDLRGRVYSITRK